MIELLLNFVIGTVGFRLCWAFTKRAKMSWILVIAIGAIEVICLPSVRSDRCESGVRYAQSSVAARGGFEEFLLGQRI